MKQIMNTLKFIRVIDEHDGKVSLTNTALLIVLTKLLIAPAVGFTEIGALFVTLLSYQSKKVIAGNQSEALDEKVAEIVASSNSQQEAIEKKMEEVVGQVSALAMKVGLAPKKV